MVQLTVTPAAKAAIGEYCGLREAGRSLNDAEDVTKLEVLRTANLGSPIDHHELISVSRCLVQRHRDEFGKAPREVHLDALLKGATVYRPPRPPKPEPVSRRSVSAPLLSNARPRLQNIRLVCNASENKRSNDNTSV